MWGETSVASTPRLVTPFQYAADDSTSLGDDVIRSLYVDRAGTLWVGRYSGLDRFDHATGTFTHFRHTPTDPNSLSRGPVMSIYEDREGILWVGTGNIWGSEEEGGLSRFDRATASFTRYLHDPDDPYSLIDSRVTLITEDRQGSLYVGTCQSEVHRYDREEDRFMRLTADAGRPGSLYAPAPTERPGNFCPSVNILHEDASGAFWVGTYSGGLNYFDREKGTMTHFVHDSEDPHSLSRNTVTSLYEDRQGTRWIGTFRGGLNKVVPSPERWLHPMAVEGAPRNSPRTPEVASLMEDRAGRLWIGTMSGDVYPVDRSTGSSALCVQQGL